LTPLFSNELVLDFDTDEISALTGQRDALWDKVQGVDFLTINEKRAALGYDPIAGGDVFQMDASSS
jgi:phage portal protein BeeE